MADVTVHNNVNSPIAGHYRSQVWTSATVGYQFYTDVTTTDLEYKKSSDAGASWGSAVSISTAVISNFDVWYDRWTPGDTTGTKIYIAYIDDTTDDALFKSLDTSSDTLSGETQILAGASTDPTAVEISIAKSKGGRLYVDVDLDGGTEHTFKNSTDSGATWSSALATANESVYDYFILLPGNYADQNDMDLLFWDRSANEISLKTYDDSGNTWSEASILAATDSTITTAGEGWAASVRLSDGHIILAFASERDTATADLKVYDINGSGSITAKTNIITDKDDFYSPCVFIDQNTNDIYVGYIGKSDGSETLGTAVNVYYVKSTDGGATWGVETLVSATTYVAVGLYSDLGGINSVFAPVWRDNTSGDEFINAGNAVAINAPSGIHQMVNAAFIRGGAVHGGLVRV